MFRYQQSLPPQHHQAPPMKSSGGGGWSLRKMFGFDSKPEPITQSNYYAPEVRYFHFSC